MKRSFRLLLLVLITCSTIIALADAKKNSKSKRLKKLPPNIAAWAKNQHKYKRRPPTAGLTNTIVIGSAPNCTGSGLCNTMGSPSSSLAISYTTDPTNFYIDITAASVQPPNDVKLYMSGSDFLFSSSWAIPDSVVHDHSLPFNTVDSGSYQIFNAGAGQYCIVIPLQPQ